MLLADYRMPQMNGIEFLEQAMDLYPNARRVLLTAYADTDAAINAINVVDLDYYLLKPWDPPEEKLYPVLDEQLAAWHDRPPAGAGDEGRRPPLVGAFVGRARVPRPQPGAVSLVPVRGPRRPAAARGGRRRRPAPAGRDHDRRRRAGRTHRRRARHAGRAGHRARQAVLRPGRHRRRAGRARRRGLRRVRRACAPSWSSGPPPAGRPGRAHASRTTSASPTASPARS